MKICKPNEIKFPIIINNEKEEINFNKKLYRTEYRIGFGILNGKTNKYPYELKLIIGNSLLKTII